MASPFKRLDPEEEALKHLCWTVAQIPTRLIFERWLLGFPADTRLQVRQMVQSAASWTIEHRRAARLRREQEAQGIRRRALERAGVCV